MGHRQTSGLQEDAQTPAGSWSPGLSREMQRTRHCLSASSAGFRLGSAEKDTKASPVTGRVARRLHITDETTSPVLCLLCLSRFAAITEGCCRINGKWRSGSWWGHLPRQPPSPVTPSPGTSSSCGAGQRALAWVRAVGSGGEARGHPVPNTAPVVEGDYCGN